VVRVGWVKIVVRSSSCPARSRLLHPLRRQALPQVVVVEVVAVALEEA